MTKKNLLEFLSRLYVPKSKVENYERLCRLAWDSMIRAPNKNDAGKSRLKLLMVKTIGKGTRETYNGFDVCYADFDSVGNRYATACVYDADGNGKPIRIDLQSPRITIII